MLLFDIIINKYIFLVNGLMFGAVLTVVYIN